MSLTSELKRRESAAALFMRESFPQTHPMLAELRLVEQSRPLLAAPGLRPQDHALIGTAFDYRRRYCFAPAPVQDLAPCLGISRALGTAFGRDFDRELLSAASDLATVGTALDGTMAHRR